ncbi:deoxyhypusine synthase [Candidatus Woesearchaeota archaeon]|nr:deoxyhypusine synthase [Candidatus Woesearchaeota archaeon]
MKRDPGENTQPHYYKKHAETWVKKTVSLDHFPHIQGYDLEKPFSFERFVESFGTTGFQASHVKQAIEIIREMREKKATIFLGFTSNMVSSGLREALCYLAKHKLVDVLVTTAGGIEEDFIKTMKPFVLGSFDAPGAFLLESGINRIGNIFVTNDRYVSFEQNFVPFLDMLYKKQHEEKKTFSAHEMIWELGKYMEKLPVQKEASIVYWAAKNNIPFFCPAVTDGALGDMLYFFKKRNQDFLLDVTKDMTAIVDKALNAETVGVIILGGGVVKHHIMNAQLFREGAEYAVYINTAADFDGSDSGGNLQEAMSWGKINPKTKYVKVFADATLVFPLMVEAAFKHSGKKPHGSHHNNNK